MSIVTKPIDVWADTQTHHQSTNPVNVISQRIADTENNIAETKRKIEELTHEANAYKAKRQAYLEVIEKLKNVDVTQELAPVLNKICISETKLEQKITGVNGKILDLTTAGNKLESKLAGLKEALDVVKAMPQARG